MDCCHEVRKSERTPGQCDKFAYSTFEAEGGDMRVVDLRAREHIGRMLLFAVEDVKKSIPIAYIDGGEQFAFPSL
jgi:hypothetical protein